MFDWTLAGQAFGVLVVLATLTWVVSLIKHDASIIDSVWPVFFAMTGAFYVATAGQTGALSTVGFWLLLFWAVRLCIYLTWRNWGEPEDRRYQAIRERNAPNYAIKSLPYVFLLQALLAWIIGWPLLPLLRSAAEFGPGGVIGFTLATAGIAVEALADWQMARFKAAPANVGCVMDRGLWRYSRHPNYFGECLVWWGVFLMAVNAGAALWTVVSPALITFLLLKVSGVTLLEHDIGERRPAYADYRRRTSPFIPWPPRQTGEGQ